MKTTTYIKKCTRTALEASRIKDYLLDYYLSHEEVGEAIIALGIKLKEKRKKNGKKKV